MYSRGIRLSNVERETKAKILAVHKNIDRQVGAAFLSRSRIEISVLPSDRVITLTILGECNFPWTFVPGADVRSPGHVVVDFTEVPISEILSSEVPLM